VSKQMNMPMRDDHVVMRSHPRPRYVESVLGRRAAPPCTGWISTMSDRPSLERWLRPDFVEGIRAASRLAIDPVGPADHAEEAISR
jgi:hypothetical protein